MLNGKSINDALDYATNMTWNTATFSDSVFYNGFTLNSGKNGKMVIYGDGNLKIGSATSTPPLPNAPPKPQQGNGGGDPWACPK
jgi:hypothetical protein